MRGVPRLLIALCVTSTCAVAAPLTVIEDTGETLPLAPYLGVLNAQEAVTREETQSSDSPESTIAPLRFPIRTSTLSPGLVARRELMHPASAPVFLIGCDAWSKRWLLAHRAQLKHLGAAGMVVDAPDEASLRSLIALADGLAFLPAPASDWAAALGLTHYPVLILGDHLEQ